ncbi:MAG: HEAT repeat domain-containing protein [Bacteroidales bacterium]|nr:HEAT repeat domain-containing protein [Bacteroidales bacterium]
MAYLIIALMGPYAVIPALKDPDANIRTAAAAALAASRDSGALDVLVAILKNEEYWSDRSNAATSLGIIGDKRAIEPLFRQKLSAFL